MNQWVSGPTSKALFHMGGECREVVVCRCSKMGVCATGECCFKKTNRKCYIYIYILYTFLPPF